MEKFTFTGTRTNGIIDGKRDEWYALLDQDRTTVEGLASARADGVPVPHMPRSWHTLRVVCQASV